jgi:hypothetical protein
MDDRVPNLDREEFRLKMKEEREREWIRDSLRLQGRKPEESLATLFDMMTFCEKLNKAVRCSQGP